MPNPNVIPTAKAKDITDKLRKAPTKVEPKTAPLSILQKVHNDPKFTTARSVDWFRKKINDLGGNSPATKTELLKCERSESCRKCSVSRATNSR